MRYPLSTSFITFCALLVSAAPVWTQIKPGDYGARFGDPCRTASLFGTSARSEAQKDPAFAAALDEQLAARVELDKLVSTGFAGANLARMQAEQALDRMLRSPEVASRLDALRTLCADVITGRIGLTRDASKRHHEITLLREDTARLRQGLKQYSFNAETERFLSEGKDLKTASQRLDRDIVTATAQRDRIRALAAGR